MNRKRRDLILNVWNSGKHRWVRSRDGDSFNIPIPFDPMPVPIKLETINADRMVENHLQFNFVRKGVNSYIECEGLIVALVFE